jgi:hypothetical protein
MQVPDWFCQSLRQNRGNISDIFKEWFWAQVRDGTGSSGMKSIFVANTLEVAGNTNDQAL